MNFKWLALVALAALLLARECVRSARNQHARRKEDLRVAAAQLDRLDRAQRLGCAKIGAGRAEHRAVVAVPAWC